MKRIVKELRQRHNFIIEDHNIIVMLDPIGHLQAHASITQTIVVARLHSYNERKVVVHNMPCTRLSNSHACT